ncbi:hypothetical protein VCV18_006004 [Metarhizium anisopliae]
MLLPTAGFLLLCALQPALAQAPADCSSNKLLFKQITPHEIIMGYKAKNTGCDAGARAWVGIWDANAALKTNFKAWKYLEADEGEVRFTKTDLGDGQWKAAFVCEDGWRIPFLLSGNFELGSRVSSTGTCIVRRDNPGSEWETWSCDEFDEGCSLDCGYTLSCGLCNDCARQCNMPADYEDYSWGDDSKWSVN